MTAPGVLLPGRVFPLGARRCPSGEAHRTGDPLAGAPVGGQHTADRARGLRAETWIGGGPSSASFRIVKGACSHAGLEPRVVLSSDDYIAVQSFVAAGIGGRGDAGAWCRPPGATGPRQTACAPGCHSQGGGGEPSGPVPVTGHARHDRPACGHDAAPANPLAARIGASTHRDCHSLQVGRFIRARAASPGLRSARSVDERRQGARSARDDTLPERSRTGAPRTSARGRHRLVRAGRRSRGAATALAVR